MAGCRRRVRGGARGVRAARRGAGGMRRHGGGGLQAGTASAARATPLEASLCTRRRSGWRRTEAARVGAHSGGGRAVVRRLHRVGAAAVHRLAPPHTSLRDAAYLCPRTGVGGYVGHGGGLGTPGRCPPRITTWRGGSSRCFLCGRVGGAALGGSSGRRRNKDRAFWRARAASTALPPHVEWRPHAGGTHASASASRTCFGIAARPPRLLVGEQQQEQSGEHALRAGLETVVEPARLPRDF